MSAPSLATAIEASMKPRWLRHMTATESPSPTPRSDSARASELERRCSSPQVSSPSSSITPTWWGERAASVAKPPAGPVPQRCTTRPRLASVRGP